MKKHESYVAYRIVRDYKLKKKYNKDNKCLVDDKKNCNDCLYNEFCEMRKI